MADERMGDVRGGNDTDRGGLYTSVAIGSVGGVQLVTADKTIL